MLAAGGLLGLLLVGAAAGGLLSTYSGDRAEPDDDAPRDDAGDTGADDATDGSTDLLEEFLFGPDALGAEEPEAALREADDLLDVRETVPFGEGVAIPLVRDFDPATDRLVLDFTGTEQEAPYISIDLETSPGNAVVEADGTAVTLVLGASAMTPAHVDVVMNPPPADPEDEPVTFDFLLDGGDAGDAAAGRAAMQDTLSSGGRDALTAGPGNASISGGAMDTVSGGAGSDLFVAGEYVASAERPGLVTDFDPASDRIEIVYDPATLPDPEIGIVDHEDGDGSSITLNGSAVLHLAGVQGLDPASISLRALS